MAKTLKNIYYPDNYEAEADIPADMKKLAESVDETIKETERKIQNYDDTTITQRLNKLDTTVQSNIVQTHIVKVTTEIKELKEYELPCSYIMRQWGHRNILQQ